MIHFKEPQWYFYIKIWKCQYQQFTQIYRVFFFLLSPSELPASFALREFEGTNLQYVNINELHDYQVWKYKTVIYDYLSLITATQDGKNANQRQQQHLDAIKKKHGLH